MKVILIIITAIAAAISLPTFNEKHILDFGNTSDIISAFCNCVVAGAAVMAFLSAKNWIYQRMHDDAYKIAKEIIFDDYNNIFEIGNLAISNIENFKTIEKYIHNDINDFVSINMCKDNIKLFTEAKNTPITTNAKIKKATRLGWELKSEAYALHSIFMKEYSMIEEINLRFWSRIERMLIISEDTKNRAVMTSSLRELLVKHDEEKLNFYKAYDNLSLYSKDITSYFNIKK